MSGHRQEDRSVPGDLLARPSRAPHVATLPPLRVHAALGGALRGAGSWLLHRPWWLQALLVWAASRAWGVLLFTVVDRQSYRDGPWGEGPLGYFRYVSIWDGSWYESILTEGYPTEIPRDAEGTAQANAWAFYPVYPYLVRVLMQVTGLPWSAAASSAALVFGFGAAVLMLQLFRRLLPGPGALWALAVVAFSAAAPVLQAAYAESLHLGLLAAALLLVLDRRALWAAPLILVLCLTRPAGVPFAAALGLTWFIRSCLALREQEPEHRLGHLPGLFDRWFWLALWACACALLWPLIAWLVTGEPRAYTDTETAWRGTGLVVVEPWLALGGRLLGQGWGWLLLLAVAGGFGLVMTSRVVRAVLPLGVRVWAIAYGVYLLLFLHPQSSTFRMLLPLFVLAVPLVALSDSRAYRWLLVIVGVLSQIVWVGYLWQWSPLPGGGDYPP